MTRRMGVTFLSLIGIFVAAYLYLYKIGKIGSVMCGTGGCETVQLSRWSSFLGVDVALIGIVGYAGLFALSLVSLQPRLAGDRRGAVGLGRVERQRRGQQRRAGGRAWRRSVAWSGLLPRGRPSPAPREFP